MPPTGFRVPPPEDPSPVRDPHVAFRSLVRVISEFGFVSSIIAGICIQRNGVIHQTNMAADATKLLVLVAGTASFAANIVCLYDDSIFAPKYPDDFEDDFEWLRQQRRRIPRQRRQRIG